jgi:hypothetical protein
MEVFLKAMSGAFLGRLAAAGFIAVCIAMGVGPDKWAAFVVSGLPITPTEARIVFGIIALLGTGGLLWSFWARSPAIALITPNSAGSVPDNKPDASTPRLFVGSGVTVFYLTNLYDSEHTHIQSDALAKPFLGKWMRLSGVVHNVQATALSVKVTFKGKTGAPAEEFSDVHMTFGPAWKDRLSIVTRGEVITLVGKIASITQYNLFLENCELDGS